MADAGTRRAGRGNLTEGPIAKTLLAFALPTLASSILQSLNGTVNAIWVGRFLGEGALAATSNANMVMFLLTSFVFGFGMASTILIGQAWGGRQGMILGFGLALLMNGTAYFFSDKIALMMYSAIWLTRLTSECRRWRITVLTASMSVAIDWVMLFCCAGGVAADKANLLGAILVTQFQLAALARAGVPEDDRVDFFLAIDEFHNFTTDSFAAILAEARKYRLCLSLSHQYIDQLALPVRQAVLGNVGTPDDTDALTLISPEVDPLASKHAAWALAQIATRAE